jgi:hypothetical protein
MTNYYIDPDDGTSGGAGTFADPLDSWANLPSMSESDCVYFLCGTTFTAPDRLRIQWSGTEANPAVIGAYYSDGGSPAAAVHGVNGDGRPIISGSNYTIPANDSYQGLIHISGEYGYITIENIEVYRSGDVGVYLTGNYTADSPHNITISNVYINGSWGSGIYCNKVAYAYVTVEDCEVYHHNHRVPTVGGNWGAGISFVNSPYANATVRRNYVHEGYGEGISSTRVVQLSVADHCGHVTVEDNLIWNNRRVSIYFNSTEYNIARRNIAIGAGPSVVISAGTEEGRGWNASGITVNSEVRTTPLSNVVNYNTVYNNIVVGHATGFTFGSAYTENASSTGNKFYNNTAIANLRNYSISSEIGSNTLSGIEFKNNISLCPSDSTSVDVRDNYTWIATKSGLVIDYNSWHSQPSNWAGDNDVQTDGNWTQIAGFQSLTAPIDIDVLQPLEICSAVGAATPLGSPYNLKIADTSTYDVGPPLAIDVDTVENDTDLGAIPFQGTTSTGYEYVGYYTSSGEPTSNPSIETYLADDRTYLRKWTATEDGTARSVRFYVADTWDSNATWVVAYKDAVGAGNLSILGYAAIEDPSVTDDWTAAYTISAPPGGDLGFSSGDDLYFGFAVDPVGAETCETARENTGTNALHYITTSLASGVLLEIDVGDVNVSAVSFELPFVLEYSVGGAVSDTTDPTVAIITPADDPYTATGLHNVTVAGVASDVSGISLVEWETTHGGAGTALGTTEWTALDVPISSGATTITITATDAAGNDDDDTIVVNFAGPTGGVLLGYDDEDSSGIPTTTPDYISITDAPRHYFRVPETTTEAGMISGVYFYAGATWDPLAAWVAVYQYHSSSVYELLGYAEIGEVAYEAWNFVPITTPAAGKSLIFESGTVLVPSLVLSCDENNQVYYGRDYPAAENTLFASTAIGSVPTSAFLTAGLSTSLFDRAITICYVPTSLDVTDPVVTITSHTSPYSAGTAPTITIAGTATDDVGVVEVTWEDDQGHSGTASGTSSWMIADAELVVGTTVFTITAEDAAENTGEAELTVTRVSATASRLPKIYDGDKVTAAMTYSSSEPGGEIKWIQYAYKIQDIIDRVIVWSPDNMSGYVGLSEDGIIWNYYGGVDASEALDDDGRMVDYGTETPYGVLMVGGGAYNLPLPQARTARYGRFYFHVPESETRTINELRIVREVVAEQMYAENLGAISADITGVSAGTMQSQNLDGDTGTLIDLNNANAIFGGTESKKIELDGEDGIAYVREGGKLVVGDNNITLDSTNTGGSQGRIEVAPDGGKTGQDYVLIESGNVTQMYYSAGAHRPYGTLNRIEVGVGTHGETITIPGYWREQPRVVIMPESIAVYNASYSAQNQKLICRPTNLQLVAGTTDRYQFTGFMALEISSASVVGDGTMTGFVYTPTSRNDFPAVTVTCSSVEAGCQRVVITYSHNCCYGEPQQMYSISRTVNFDVYYSAAWHTIKSEYWRRYTTYADRIYSTADTGWVGANITSYRLTMSGTNAYEIAGGGDQKSQSLEPVSRTEYLSSTTQQVTGQYTWMASGR